MATLRVNRDFGYQFLPRFAHYKTKMFDCIVTWPNWLVCSIFSFC